MSRQPEALAAYTGPRAKPEHNLLRRFRKKPTLRSAASAMCFVCMGGTEDDHEGVREEIRRCTAPQCPLYDWRPYR